MNLIRTSSPVLPRSISGSFYAMQETLQDKNPIQMSPPVLPPTSSDGMFLCSAQCDMMIEKKFLVSFTLRDSAEPPRSPMA
mmetsp:Transcript_1896/g.4711  ORF Transcript_1896/g.4711 Transcript_1896/m.4711 type:complete len:81 (+) Transcript_1896:113-355(+)